MSALDSGGVLKPILLRSTTPTPNEKVMRYFQSMSGTDEPTNSPPRSMVGGEDYRSNVSQSRVRSPNPKSNVTANGNGHAANGHIEEEDADDGDSNVQQGERSELGDPTHEPGPNDAPGPKYASYDSGPSFGNMGPMPGEEQPMMHPYGGSGWNPDWTQIRNEGSGTPPSKAGSRAPSNNGANRPFSPAQRSRGPTEQGTAYPPLPESALGYANGDPTWEPPLSPRSRAWSKAPSISPSDSASHFPKPRALPKSVVSNAMSRSPPPQGSPSPLSQSGGPNHQSRPFSPYRHAPTTEDLLHAAVRGRALAIPEVEEEKTVSSIKAQSQAAQSVAQSRAGSRASGSPSKQPSQLRTPQQQPASMAPSNASPTKSVASSRVTAQSKTASRASKPPSAAPSVQSVARTADRSAVSHTRSNRTLSDVDPDDYDQEEADIINDALAAQLPAQTPRTSIYARSIEPGLTGHFHDDELCQLLRHESDQNQPEVIRKALRKAIRQRVKKLGIHYDTEAIKEYKRSYQDHDHGAPAEHDDQEPPRWASDLKREIVLMQQRIESLGPKIENLRYEHSYDHAPDSRFAYEDETRTPRTQTVNIETQATGTMADSMWQPGDEDMTMDEEAGHMREFDDMTETQPAPETQGYPSEAGREDSTGQQFLEEELYKLKQRPAKTQSALSHRTWEITKNNPAGDDDEEYDEDAMRGVPTIPDTNGEGYQDGDREGTVSPPLPPLPNPDDTTENGDGEGHSRQLEVHGQGAWNSIDYGADGNGNGMPPWQRIHSRLLSWAIIWPTTELENALNSTTRGHQVDEVALSVWSTQTYKRYVRARLTEGGNGTGVDRLFVPPNMADAISNAVFNGRHGEACGMLRDLWIPFGLEGTPRLIVVLARHRSDPNHWVVHRFSLPDGNLTTYDSYPERTLPDGRPLGWWFAIRIAWPSSIYPNPDNIVQKMVRLHRPMQLPIDNSVAAAGIWRNILMGSRAERSLDLERLRDLINTEVKNLKQRKLLGKLTVGGTRGWEETR
ncbi:hypothetical protein BKA70DRAFT_668464 [Coprinopsis sp. MPI-PUGE-AT-0042]|nr:hypothetical protein BKA70DRAFT_668464 [Coprinopsis sp. MPI-PUGE-AT-0042]